MLRKTSSPSEVVLLFSTGLWIGYDLPSSAPSLIMRVCGFGFQFLRRQFGQARRWRSPQIANAVDALKRVSGSSVMNAV